MPRNKSAKRSKPRQTMSNILADVQKMEKELMQIPSKLAAQISKEINAHKKQQNKLKSAANKAKALVKAMEARLNAQAKSKSSSAKAKKQLNTAKKSHIEAIKAHSAVNKQLEAASQTLQAMSSKQAKLNSLGKYINQFEKEWEKTVKAAKAKLVAKPKTKKVKTNSRQKQISPSMGETHFQPADVAVENVKMDEITELAS